MKNTFFIFIIVTFIFYGKTSNAQKNTAGNYEYHTECISVELDGSQTVKAWGSGRNRSDAIEQAMKNAIRDILFKGISNGKSDCNQKPVISEVNAQEKYSSYFNKFFSDGGEYKNFISGEDGSKYHLDIIKDRKQAGSQKTYGLIIRILRTELTDQMKKDGILKTN